MISNVSAVVIWPSVRLGAGVTAVRTPEQEREEN
jgi:hypothetical protein